MLSPSTKFNPNVQKSAVSQDRSEKKAKKQRNKENKVGKPPLRLHRPQTLNYKESDFLKQETTLLESNGFTFRNCEISGQGSIFEDMAEPQEDKYFNKEDVHFSLFSSL